MGAEAMTERVEIIKPRNDKREYRRIALQNNLQVLLISDSETDKELVTKEYQNLKFQQPYQQAMYYLLINTTRSIMAVVRRT